jgi:hypothetical protein
MGDGSPRSGAAKATATRIQLGCGAAFFAVFLAVGLGIVVFVVARDPAQKAPGIGVAALFAFFGLWGMVQVFRGWSRAGAPEPGRGVGPDEPWRKSHALDTNVVLGNNPAAGIAVWAVFTLIWFGPIVAVTFLAWDKFTQEAWLIGLLGVFWLAGLFLISMTVHSILHALKYPRCSLVMDAVPARLDGWVSGVVRVPLSVQEGEIDLSVNAIKTMRSGRSGSRTWTLWSEATLIDGARCERRGDHLAIPFAVRLPPNTPEPEGVVANLLQGSNSLVGPEVTWWVSVNASVPGVDYNDRFEIPVGDVDPAAPAPPAQPPRAVPVLAGEKLAGRLHGHVEHGHDADSFIFPNRPLWIAWVVVPALITAVCMVDAALRVIHGKTPDDPNAGGLLPFMSFEGAVFTALAMGGLAALSLLGNMFDTRRIDVTHSEVRVRRGLMGIGFHRTIPRGQVTAVEAKASGLQQPTYEVKLLLHGGGEQAVSTGLRALDQAEALAVRLRSVLGL